MSEQRLPDWRDRLAVAYDYLLERTREALHGGGHTLEQALDKALERESEVEELTREELGHVAGYIRRDLHDAADYLNRTGQELKGWLRFDLELVETLMAERFSSMVDHTREELLRLELEAQRVGEWKSGEVTGIGTLECKGCGEQLHFHHTAHIPPCPRCHGTHYRRRGRD